MADWLNENSRWKQKIGALPAIAWPFVIVGIVVMLFVIAGVLWALGAGGS